MLTFLPTGLNYRNNSYSNISKETFEGMQFIHGRSKYSFLLYHELLQYLKFQLDEVHGSMFQEKSKCT